MALVLNIPKIQLKLGKAFKGAFYGYARKLHKKYWLLTLITATS